jgi:hypothetical protein
LPLRVFGKFGANWILSTVAIAPISLRTSFTNAVLSSSVGLTPFEKGEELEGEAEGILSWPRAWQQQNNFRLTLQHFAFFIHNLWFNAKKWLTR